MKKELLKNTRSLPSISNNDKKKTFHFPSRNSPPLATTKMTTLTTPTTTTTSILFAKPQA
jgi:hypothetical protein